MRCPRCEVREAVVGRAYCHPCEADYMRIYRRTHAERVIKRTRAAGAEAFRLCAVRKFRELAEKDPKMLVAARVLETLRMG